MMIFLGTIQLILITFICVFEFKNKSSSVFLWATLLIMFGIMHFLTCLTGDMTYNDSVINEASIFVILFCIVYLIARFVLGNKTIIESREKISFQGIKENLPENVLKISKILLVFLVVTLMLKMIPYLRYNGGLLESSWAGGRSYTSSLSYANSTQIYNIILYSISGIITLFYVEGNKKMALVSGLLFLVEVLITRNRIEILPILCSIITILVLKYKKVSLKLIVLGLIGGIVVVYVVYGIRVYRHYGTIANFINTFNFADFNKKIMYYIETGNGELGLRQDFYFFISHNNEFAGFGKCASYIRMLLVYIPTRFSFGLKPADFAITMGAAIGMGPGGSTHPTLFGDCYANLGFYGIFLGAFWAIYVNVIDKIIIKNKSYITKILIFILSSVVFCIVGRGSVYNGTWFVFYGVPLLLMCSKLFSKKIKFKKTRGVN